MYDSLRLKYHILIHFVVHPTDSNKKIILMVITIMQRKQKKKTEESRIQSQSR